MLLQAKLYVDALAGNRQAMVAVMTDQSVNVYGEQLVGIEQCAASLRPQGVQ